MGGRASVRHKYTNTQIHKHTNTKITNTQIQSSKKAKRRQKGAVRGQKGWWANVRREQR